MPFCKNCSKANDSLRSFFSAIFSWGGGENYVSCWILWSYVKLLTVFAYQVENMRWILPGWEHNRSSFCSMFHCTISDRTFEKYDSSSSSTLGLPLPMNISRYNFNTWGSDLPEQSDNSKITTKSLFSVHILPHSFAFILALITLGNCISAKFCYAI